MEGVVHIRAIAWDFDGVLNRAGVAGADGRFRWQHRMQAEFGVETIGLARQVFGQDRRALLTGADDILDRLETWVRDIRFDGSAEDILELWFAAENEPDEALQRMVAQIDSAGLTQVIATNNDPRRARFIAQDSGWGERVEAIFASGEMGVMKPDVAFYERIETALGLPPHEILLIDDLERNIDGADTRGWLTWHYQPGGAMALAKALMPLLLRADP
jgi:putative hydrolase of the HAD superfamily